MPVTIKKMKGGKVQVRTPNMIHAKGTTMDRAKAQERLLNAVEHGWKPKENNRKFREYAKKRGKSVKTSMST